jgi:hypothetical protein
VGTQGIETAIGIEMEVLIRESYLLPCRAKVSHIIKIVMNALKGLSDFDVLIPFVRMIESLTVQ